MQIDKIQDIKEAAIEARRLKGTYMEAQDYADDVEFLLSTIEGLKGEVTRLNHQLAESRKNTLAALEDNDALREEVEMLRHIAGLLASRINIVDEVFDQLSAEDDYDFFSSKALQGSE